MSYPTQSPWDIYYWDEDTISTILDPTTGLEHSGNVSITAGGYLLMEGSDGAWRFVRTDTTSPISPGGGGNTIEFDVNFAHLPLDVGTDKGLVVDFIQNSGGTAYQCGFLIARGSIRPRMDSSYFGNVEPLGLGLNKWYRFRFVPGEPNVGANRLYVAEVSSLSVVGFSQVGVDIPWINLGSSTTDLIYFAVNTASDAVVSATFRRMVAADEPLIPATVPVAHATGSVDVRDGQYIVLDARDSEYPSGHTVMYKWELVEAPSNSSYVYAGIAKTDPGNPKRFLFPQNLPSTLRAGDPVTVIGYGSTNISTDSADIDGTLLSAASFLVDDDLGIPAGTQGLVVNVLAGGIIADPDSALTYAVPDSVGVYRFKLTVTDMDSGFTDTVEKTVQVNPSMFTEASPLDLSWLWQLLGSQWNIITDRQKLQVIWEAMSLAATDLLLDMWQVNASKSLATIPRQYVRTWWNIPNRALSSVTGEPQVGDIIPPVVFEGTSFNVSGQTLTFYVGGIEYEVTFTGTDPIDYGEVIEQINAVCAGVARKGTGAVVLQSLVPIYVSGDGAGAALGAGSGAWSVWELPATVSSARQFGVTGFAHDFEELSPKWVGVNGTVYKVSSITKTTSGYTVTVMDDTGLSVGSSVTLIVAPTMSWPSLDPSILELGEDDAVVYAADSEYYEDTPLAASSTVLLYRPDGTARNSDLRYVWLEKRNNIPVYRGIVDAPVITSSPEDAEYVYRRGVDYDVSVESDTTWIRFRDGKALPSGVDNWWVPRVYIDAAPTIYDNFGWMVDTKPGEVGGNDYLRTIGGIWSSLLSGPTVEQAQYLAALAAGMPVVDREGVVIDIQEDFSPQYSRVLVYEQETGNVGVYRYTRGATRSINPETGVAWAVGDSIQAGTILCNEVPEVWDVNTMSEGTFGIEDYHRIHAGVNVQSSSLGEASLAHVQKLMARIRPLWAKMTVLADKVISTEINWSDEVSVNGSIVVNDIIGLLTWNSVGAVPLFNDHDGGSKYRNMMSVGRMSGIVGEHLLDAAIGVGGPTFLSRRLDVGSGLLEGKTLWIYSPDRSSEYPPFPDQSVSFMSDYDKGWNKFVYCNRYSENVTVSLDSGNALTAGTHHCGTYGLRVDGSGSAEGIVRYADVVLRPGRGSISFWVNITSSTGHFFFTDSGSGTDKVFNLSISGGKIRFQIRSADGVLHTYMTETATTGYVLYNVVWEHGSVVLYAGGNKIYDKSLSAASCSDICLASAVGVNTYFDQLMYFIDPVVVPVGCYGHPVRFTSDSVVDAVTEINNAYSETPAHSLGLDRFYLKIPAQSARLAGTVLSEFGFTDQLTAASAVKKDLDDLGILHEFWVAGTRVR